MEYKENIPLASYTSLKIGGPAEYLLEVKNEEEVIDAVNFARGQNLTVHILGGGTNALISDRGLSGIVIVMRNRGIIVEEDRMIVEAGTPMGEVVAQSVRAEFAGLSWAGGLPGTVGGAVFGNAGTFGHAIGDSVESVEIIDEHGEHRTIAKKDCGFGYRTSAFKEQHLHWVILSVTLILQPGDKEQLRKEMMDAIAFRNTHHPAPSSAGSFFKNPEVRPPTEVGPRHIVPPANLIQWFGKIPAGWLIEKAGLKGLQVGGAKISEMHANFVVNAGNATAKDIRALAQKAKDAVREKFGVELEEEVRYLR